MTKRKSASSAAAAAESYDSDGGFVEDAPRSKKAKGAKNGGGGEDGGGRSKKEERKEGVGKKDGEEFWELTSKRRVGISEFKGQNMINIREYYEKDGEALPGKKGISLPIEQFNTLIKLLPQIETALAEKGESIERPDYGGVGASAAVDEDDDEEDEEVEKKGKKNFEETSDEE